MYRLAWSFSVHQCDKYSFSENSERVIGAMSWDSGTFCPLLTHSSNVHAQSSSGARCLFLVGPFIYFHTSCANREGSGETSKCAGSPQLSLVVCVISTIILWAGSFKYPLSLSFPLNVHSCHNDFSYRISSLYSSLVLINQNYRLISMCVCVFGLNVALNNFSVISRRCLVTTKSCALL